MQLLDSNTEAFLTLVRSGLWEIDAQFFEYNAIDFSQVLKLAEEQSVVGLVAAGIEHVTGVKVPKEITLQFIGHTIHLEQRNAAMNSLISELVNRMREADICSLLVKGQGVAQCYARPLWRSSGDIDFLLGKDDYMNAADCLIPLASNSKNGGRYSKEIGLTINTCLVEVHGSLRTGLSARIDNVVDAVERDIFYSGNVRSWDNLGTTIFLPAPNNDVFLVFTHFIKHFYKEGMILRQICDWCRLLWTYKDTINPLLIEGWLKRAGLMDEWQAFAAIAVDYLGMPIEAMPLYIDNKKSHIKGRKIISIILNGRVDNKVQETFAIAMAFPSKTLCYLPSIFLNVNWLKIKERLLGL